MIKNNTVLKVLSLLLAIALWAFVLGEVNPTVKKTIYDVPVQFTGAEDLGERDLAIVTQEGYTVDIVIEGSRSNVGQLEISDIQATADLYGCKKGENSVSVDVALPGNISLKEIKTPEVSVAVEELVSVTKPVTVKFTGKIIDKTEASAVSVTPSEVEVKGAESVVNRVDTVEVTIASEELTKDISVFEKVPTALNKKGKQVKGVSITADTVEVEAVLYYTKSVPLEVEVTGAPEDARVTVPDVITIKGTAEALSKITSIKAGYIDISDAAESAVIPLKPVLPYGIEIADISKDIGIEIDFD